jgi:ubiquitin carboxyl-terminal hydrolase 4/11/15
MVDGANEDEGFVDADDDERFESMNSYGAYGGNDDAVWSFQSLGAERNRDPDDVASDQPDVGSEGASELENRLLEDFGDDGLLMGNGGVTPHDDGEVHEIRVSGE